MLPLIFDVTQGQATLMQNMAESQFRIPFEASAAIL
jgi:hypothetical protein